MKRETKKTPQDYPQLAFRIAASDKAEIMRRVEELVLALNKNRDLNEKKVLKNDVLVEAIKKGLAQIKKGIRS